MYVVCATYYFPYYNLMVPITANYYIPRTAYLLIRYYDLLQITTYARLLINGVCAYHYTTIVANY